jgi:hypothetical protein
LDVLNGDLDPSVLLDTTPLPVLVRGDIDVVGTSTLTTGYMRRFWNQRMKDWRTAVKMVNAKEDVMRRALRINGSLDIGIMWSTIPMADILVSLAYDGFIYFLLT